MDEELLQVARDYAQQHGAVLRGRLGFGIHGIVFVVESKAKPGRSAVKFHEDSESYHREKSVYQRLGEHGLTEIRGFHVPQFLSFDDEFRAIEMTIVKPPFVLDFAGAWLDRPPAFPAETMVEWQKEKQEQFGKRWNTVEELMRAFHELEIYLLDVSPNNIAFRDKEDGK